MGIQKQLWKKTAKLRKNKWQPLPTPIASARKLDVKYTICWSRFNATVTKQSKFVSKKIKILKRAASTFITQFQITSSVTPSKLAKVQGDIHLSWGISKFGVWITNSWRVDKLAHLPTSRLMSNFRKSSKLHSITVRSKHLSKLVSRNSQDISTSCWNKTSIPLSDDTNWDMNG